MRYRGRTFMRHGKWTIALAVLVMVAGCDDTSSTGVEGTYEVTLTYNVDTCVNDVGRSEAIEITIEREGDNVTFLIGDSGTLTGTFDNETRIMTVDGTILAPDPGGGTFSGEMLMFARVTEGELNASGGITFEGTFPGVPGTCERAFLATGERRGNLSPFSLTGS
jgi:hypothetical protein